MLYTLIRDINGFCKVLEIFQGDFWSIDRQKRNGIEEGKQCGWRGRSNALRPSFGAKLKVVEVDSKERNVRNDKNKLKNYVFPFRMNMRKIRTIVRNGPEKNLVATQRENWKLISHDHAKISHNHAKYSRKAKLVLMHFSLRTIVQNCIFFPDFFVKKVFGRPLRWCQVSTWPWPINRNLIYSFKNFWCIF